MRAPSSGDALDALAQAVEHLLKAHLATKRHEPVAFWNEIDHARTCLAEARLGIRGAGLSGDAAT
jgi:hypothetical protein